MAGMEFRTEQPVAVCVRGTAAPMIGRRDELGAIERHLDAPVRRPAALVLEGEPGVGKTTLWQAGIAAAQERGLRVLSARPSGAEAQLSFAALIDLLDGVDAAELGALPAPQRRALDAALLRAEPLDGAANPHAVRVAFLNTLRSLATDA